MFSSRQGVFLHLTFQQVQFTFSARERAIKLGVYKERRTHVLVAGFFRVINNDFILIGA